MELNEEWLNKARERFYEPGELAAAIETYLAEMLKPDKGMILEPLEAIPQRDYRKELWIEIFTHEGLKGANDALAKFDMTFPQENHHG